MIDPKTIEDYVEFWNYGIGCNAIPANTPLKKTYIKWSEWQTKAIPKEQINQWLVNGAYNNGIAVIAGKIYKGANEGKYLTFVDCDNQKAIDLFLKALCARSIDAAKDHLIVEMHKDNPSKVHFYFLSNKPLPTKGPNKLGLEIKSAGTGIAYCTPGVHKDGHPYEIIGTHSPVTWSDRNLDLINKRLRDTFKEHGQHYELREYLPYKFTGPKTTRLIPENKLEQYAQKWATKYVRGQVHDLIWAIAGDCRKSGVPQYQTEQLVKRICELGGDSERWVNHHIGEVRQTYAKDITRPMTGRNKLKELLGQW